MPSLWLIDLKSSTTGNEGLPPHREVYFQVLLQNLLKHLETGSQIVNPQSCMDDLATLKRRKAEYCVHNIQQTEMQVYWLEHVMGFTSIHTSNYSET